MRHYKFTWCDRTGRVTATATVCNANDESGMTPRQCITAAKDAARALNAEQGPDAGHGEPVLLYTAPGAARTAWTARPDRAERSLP